METPFPCPFCCSTWVHVVGGGRRFVHYQCGSCSEVWTAQSVPALVSVRREPSDTLPALPQTDKVLLN
jgi:transposase-like protein